MELHRLLFKDRDSKETYQFWFASQEEAEKERRQVMLDRLCYGTPVLDVVELSTKNGRHTKPALIQFLNMYALIKPE